MSRFDDQVLVELVDAIVGAVDEQRTDEVARVREALDVLGLGVAFTDELRLNGRGTWECQYCGGGALLAEFEAVA